MFWRPPTFCGSPRRPVATDVRKVLLSAVANSKVKAENAGETFNEADLLVLEAYVTRARP